MTNLLSCFSKDLHLRAAKILYEKRNITISGAGTYSSKSLLVFDVLRSLQKKEFSKILWIVNSKAERDLMEREILRWSGTPTHGLSLTRKFDFEPQDIDVVRKEDIRADRIQLIRFISDMISGQKITLVVPFFYITQNLPDPLELKKSIFSFSVDQKIDPVALFEMFITHGYEVSPDVQSLEPGSYFRAGDSVLFWPVNSQNPMRLEMEFDKIHQISILDAVDKNFIKTVSETDVYSLTYSSYTSTLSDYLHDQFLVVEDELDINDELYEG